MRFRPEAADDASKIHDVLVEAFEGPEEAELVRRLRTAGGLFLSLVAEIEDEIVGHILFTEVSIDGWSQGLALGLAPMAVRPSCQRQGVGSALVEQGLTACRAAGASLVVVLGHPDYYPRFGFRCADEYGLAYSESVPREAFMALPLDETPAVTPPGTVRYRAEFSEVG